MMGTAKSHSRDETSSRHSLHLAELLDFRPDQGVIRLHQQRVVILSAAAMGLMRKELLDTVASTRPAASCCGLGSPMVIMTPSTCGHAPHGAVPSTASVPARCSIPCSAVFQVDSSISD
jgi:hypothetical protein